MSTKAIVQKYIKSDNEFSKRFTRSIRNFMFVHVGVSVAACIVLTILGMETKSLVDILIAMMPVYIALQGANYVKSGYENGKKIAVSSTNNSATAVENG